VARATKARFVRLNAASSGVKELRALLDEAASQLETRRQRTLLFIDELHHFNRTQQDVLLPELESGVVALIGATTQNPFFSLVPPLVSRSRVFEFRPLSAADVLCLLERALADQRRGLAACNVTCTDEALRFLAQICDGDARRALSALEVGVLSLAGTNQPFDLAVAQETVQKKAIQYGKLGDDHYDASSALIKSMRGGDPDAAIYWLARMLEAGEDPRFLARRIVICAAEDVGNADPLALVLAQAAAHASEFIGLPECRIPLAQAVTYIAMAPKSNAAIRAIDAALDDVRQERVIPVPMHLRDAHYAAAARLGRGQGYQYPHDAPEGWLPQEYLGVPKIYYLPAERGAEAGLNARLEELRRRRAAARQDQSALSPVPGKAEGGSGGPSSIDSPGRPAGG
jgi:putative ATPase